MDQDYMLDKLKGSAASVISHDDERQQLATTSDYAYIPADLLDRQVSHFPYLTSKKHELLKPPPPPSPSSLPRPEYLKSAILKEPLYMQHFHPDQHAIQTEHQAGSVEDPRRISDTEMTSTSTSISPPTVSVESVPVSHTLPLPLVARKDSIDQYRQQLASHYQSLPVSVAHYPDLERLKYEQDNHLSRGEMLGAAECQSLEETHPVTEYSTESQEEASRRLYALARIVDMKISSSYLGAGNQYTQNFAGHFMREESGSYEGFSEMEAPEEAAKVMEPVYEHKHNAGDDQGQTNTDAEIENEIRKLSHRVEDEHDGVDGFIQDDHVTQQKTDKNMCLCLTDLMIGKSFVCGGCSLKFDTVCLLHVHLKEHGSGGSYHYDHVSRTAFPKFDTFCSFTQTDAVDFAVEREPEAETVELPVEQAADKMPDSTPVAVPIKRPSRKCVAEGKDSSSVSSQGFSYSLKQSGRKRKQAHPKPSKPLMYMVPLENTRNKKKTGKRRVNAQRKVKAESKPAEDFYISDNDFDNGLDSDTDHLLDDSKRLKEDSQDATSTEDDEVEQIQQNTVRKESKEPTSLAKPFKKRGRPRKCGSQVQNGVTEKKVNVKKASMKAGRRGRRPKHPPTFTDAAEIEHSKALTKGFSEEEPTIEDDIEDTTSPTSEENMKKSPGKKKKFQICNVCGLTIPQHNYVFHMRQHTGERPFVCEKCGKSFARSRFLTKHLVTHEEVKPWQCPMCPSQFCQKNEYKMHMAGHAGDRPYQCKVCEMRFLSKTSLLTHQANIHMGLTRFECDVCKRRFFKRSSLTVHVATHFEATMKCNFCDRKFRDKTGLKRHERIHTGVKKFKCHICDHAFIQSTPFWAHMEKRHAMDKKMVKEMLHEIREQNRRSGIKTEINVLPSDVEIKPVSLSPTADTSTVGQTSSLADAPAFPIPTIVPVTISQTVKSYAEIKVPILQSLSENESRLSEVYHQVFDQDIMTRTYSPHTTIQGQSSTGTEMLLTHDATSAINLCNVTPTTPTSQYSLLHQALQTPVNSAVTTMSHHGFIGLTQLQQAVDFTGTIPQSMAYTDLSERIIDHQ